MTSEKASMFRFMSEIHIIAQLSGRAFEAVMHDGMTLSQFSVLNHLIRMGDGKSPLQIAKAMQVSKGTMTNTLNRLERAGHIQTTADLTDGRSKRVQLCAKGRAAHGRAVEAVSPLFDDLVDALRPETIAVTLPVLESVRTYLDKIRSKGNNA